MICTLLYSLRDLVQQAPPPPTHLLKIPTRPPTDSVSRGCSRTVEGRAMFWRLNATNLLPTFSLPSSTHTSSMLGGSTSNMLISSLFPTSILCLDRTTWLGLEYWTKCNLTKFEEKLSLIYASWKRFYKDNFLKLIEHTNLCSSPFFKLK
jgi:hypothetical protein